MLRVISISYLFLLTIWTLLTGASVGLEAECDLERIRIPGDIVLSAIVGLREPANGFCGDYIPGEIQVASAMVWAVEKLRGSPGGISFIPNRTIGIELSEDCSLQRKSVQSALATLEGHRYADVSQCLRHETCRDETSIIAGLIHTSTSQTAERVAQLFEGTNLPVIGTAATSAALSDMDKFPNFMRTVPSDIQQTKVLIEIVKKLKWTYIVVVYTSDSYGREGLRLLKELALKEDAVCIILEISISPQEISLTTARDKMVTIANKLPRTRYEKLGVIYFGQLAQASLLVNVQNKVRSTYSDFENIFWIMSEAVGTNMPLSRNNPTDGLVSVALDSQTIPEFKTYFLDHLVKEYTNASNTPMGRLYRIYIEKMFDCKLGTKVDSSCPSLDKSDLERTYKQQGYVISAIDAVYVLASAVKKEICLNYPVCTSLVPKTHVFKDLAVNAKQSVLDYQKFDLAYIPYEFHLLKKNVSFDKKGDIVLQGYRVYNTWGGAYSEVGEYKDNKLTLHTDRIKMKDSSGRPLSGSTLPKSTCKRTCQECVIPEDIPFSYIQGDRLIVGLFSLRHEGMSGFECGELRKNTVSFLTFEAFNFAIHRIQEEYPSMNFGGIAFDDCYSPLRAEYILANFMSGKYKLFDKYTNKAIDPEKVVLVVGPLSSGVSLEVADILTKLKVPQISYGASSPDLDNRQKYPYFLRTVPSDVSQVTAIIKILQALEWKAVAVLYMNNNYGTQGMLTFKEMANKKGICVRDPAIPLSESMENEDFPGIVSKLRQTHTEVIVYFGIDTLAEKLLDTLKEFAKKDEFVFIASEAWGRSENLLAHGRADIAKGAIVLYLDTDAPVISKEFSTFMSLKDPFTCRRCSWLKLFWQNHFQCDWEDSYTGDNREICNPNQHGELQAIDNRDQRVVLTVRAIYSGAKGITSTVKSLCEQETCNVNLRHSNALLLTNKIKKVVLDAPNGPRIFQDSGNGNVGFGIYNVQFSKGEYSYELIGHSKDDDFKLDVDRLVLYDNLNVRKPYTDVDTGCFSKQCDFCRRQLANYSSTFVAVPVTPSMQTRPVADNSYTYVAPTVVAAVLFVALVVVCVVLIILVRRRRNILRGGPSQETALSNLSESGAPSAVHNQSNSNGSNSGNVEQESPYWEVGARLQQSVPSACSGSLHFQGNESSTSLNTLTRGPPLLRQSCICKESKFFASMETPAGKVLVCTNCSGICNFPANAMKFSDV